MLETIDHGRVREIRLAHPPVNALNPELVATLDAALKAAGDEADAIVLSGREGMFSAGLDVPGLLTLDRADMLKFWWGFFELQETIARSEIPTVAAITGHCPAAGTVLAMLCDYRVMVNGRYRMGLNETRVGLVVPRIIQMAFERLVGARKAEAMIVAGAMILPDEALEAGLVDELVDDNDACISSALAWCEERLALPRHAMLGNRRAMRSPLCEIYDQYGEKDMEAFVDGWFSEPVQATLQALVAQLKSKKG